VNIVMVEWTDAQAAKDGLTNWMTPEEFARWCREGLVICHSVGWLTYDNEDFIIISQTKFQDDLAESTKIPRTSIRNITTLADGE
jgi:hypothetical protein